MQITFRYFGGGSAAVVALLVAAVGAIGSGILFKNLNDKYFKD